MNLVKNFFRVALVGYLSIVSTFTPIYVYYVFLFKETINGQIPETLEGVVLACFFYIPLVLIFSVILSSIQFFMGKDLSKKNIVFIFITLATILNYTGMDLGVVTENRLLYLIVFILYSIYYFLSHFVTKRF